MKYAPPDWRCVWMIAFLFEVPQMLCPACSVTLLESQTLFPHTVIPLVNYTLW